MSGEVDGRGGDAEWIRNEYDSQTAPSPATVARKHAVDVAAELGGGGGRRGVHERADEGVFGECEGYGACC